MTTNGGHPELTIDIFADGADLAGIIELSKHPLVRGFTTNPTLMKAAGVGDYTAFAHDVLEAVPELPISFEVFADEFDEMHRQARRIAAWGDNVYVKIPVTNTRGESALDLVRRLADEDVKVNVTALMTPAQTESVVGAVKEGPPCFISVFAGRVADTGRDPIPLMRECLEVMAPHPCARLIWASPREILNVVQADSIGCHVITVTHDLLKKLSTLGKDLDDFSLETVQMFHRDAQAAGYTL